MKKTHAHTVSSCAVFAASSAGACAHELPPAQTASMWPYFGACCKFTAWEPKRPWFFHAFPCSCLLRGSNSFSAYPTSKVVIQPARIKANLRTQGCSSSPNGATRVKGHEPPPEGIQGVRNLGRTLGSSWTTSGESFSGWILWTSIFVGAYVHRALLRVVPNTLSPHASPSEAGAV